jgi:hypothetical protein
MYRRPDHRLRKIWLAPLAAMAVAGCSSGSGSSFGDRFNQAVATGTPPALASAQPGEAKTLDTCPSVEIRQGAGTLSINNNAKDPSAMQLRYQAAVVQTARECANVAGNLTAKIGLHGRLVLGPAGGPGVVDVPIRYALVEEGPQPKTLWTTLHRVPVTIAEGQSSVVFTHIEESMSVPMPPPATFDRYIIYVGFDPIGATQEKKPPARKRAPKQS